MRNFLGVDVLVNRRVRRRAQGTHQKQNLFLLDQLAHHFNRLRWTVAVVQTDEVDLASVDAALFVELLEVGSFNLADRAVGRSRTTVWHGLADFDFGIAGTGIIFFLGQYRREQGR